MSNVPECYYNGGMWDGKFIPTPTSSLQVFAKRTNFTDKRTTVHRYERADANTMDFKEETIEGLAPVKYQPRNEIVLLRVEIITTNKAGIVLPQSSLESRKYIVEAFGPKVEDLAIGDVVFLIGEKGQEWNNYPGHTDLILTHQQYVLLRIKE